ncbi:MAG: XrtA/PEP-CTERM system TPR-repeat protein PrsT [Pseudomonadota bacterium]|nr:XrtA/PEP-CTERM system TPR-repeat protein PrsT [Pseudomonadota bacterium]
MNYNKTGKRIIVPLAIAACLSAGLTGCGKKSTEEHLEAAKQFANANNSDAAIIEFKNAIKSNPKAPEPRFELGKYYLQTGDFDGAEKELNRALDLGQSASEVIPYLSVAYQKTGAENALAGVDFQMEGMTAVESAEVGFYKMQAMAQLGKNEDALALIDQLETLDTSSVYKGLALTYRDIINENAEGALSSLKALREQAPQNKDVLQQLGKLALATGDKALAMDAFGDYVEGNPTDATSKFAYITLLIEAGKTEDADPMVTELLNNNPQHPLLNQYKGIIEANAGNYEKAMSFLETAMRNGNNNPAIRLLGGYVAYQMQDFAAANEYLSEVAPALPADHPALRMLADSLLQMGQGEDASQILNRVEVDGEAGASLFSKAGYQLLRQGNVVDAKAMIEKSGTMSETAEDLARLGVLQLSVNDIDGLVNLEAAAKMAPESVVTQRTLITAYMTTNKLDKAKAASLEWAEKEPDNHTPHLFLAEIAFKQGDKEGALAEIEKAKALNPGTTEIDLVQARLLLSESDVPAAVAVLNDILKKEPGNVQARDVLYTVAVQTNEADAAAVAQGVYEQLQKTPDDLNLRLLAGRIAFANNEDDRVMSLLAPVQATVKTPKLYWNLKGQTLIRQNDVKGAAAHYDAWLKLYPQDKTAVLGMLLLLDAQQQYQQGLNLTNSFLAKQPDSQVKLLKAHFLAMTRQPKPAKAILDDMPENVKALPFVRSIYARVAILEGKSADAVKDAMTAYDANPNSQNALLVVAAYETSGQAPKVNPFIDSHLEAHPADIRIAMLKAERLIGSDKEGAKSVYAGILEQMPENFVVLNNLAYLYYEDGELNKAMELARKAVGLQPKNADSVDTLAQILIQQDKYEESLSLYESVVNDQPVADIVYLNYVQLLLDMGKKEVARRKMRNQEFTTTDGQKRAERIRVRYSL